MKFDRLQKYMIIEGDDSEAEAPPEAGADPEAELQEKIAQKIDELGEIASKQLNKIINNKTDLFINKVQKIGIDDVLLDFVTQSFIPSLDNVDNKLFITTNLDDFVIYLAEKFSERLINATKSDKKDKKKPKEIEEK